MARTEHRLTRKDLRQPDEFQTLSRQAMDFVEANRTAVMAALAAVIVLLLAIVAYRMISQSREASASAAYIGRPRAADRQEVRRSRDQVRRGRERLQRHELRATGAPRDGQRAPPGGSGRRRRHRPTRVSSRALRRPTICASSRTRGSRMRRRSSASRPMPNARSGPPPPSPDRSRRGAVRCRAQRRSRRQRRQGQGSLRAAPREAPDERVPRNRELTPDRARRHDPGCQGRSRRDSRRLEPLDPNAVRVGVRSLPRARTQRPISGIMLTNTVVTHFGFPSDFLSLSALVRSAHAYPSGETQAEEVS